MEVSEDGTREAQGRQGQEGQPQEGAEEQVGCQICPAPRDAHDGVNIRHAFTPPGVDVRTSQFDRKKPKRGHEGNHPQQPPAAPQGASQTPFDPVLRMALINKGVLTMDDLADAEEQIKIISGHVARAMGGHDDQPGSG